MNDDVHKNNLRHLAVSSKLYIYPRAHLAVKRKWEPIVTSYGCYTSHHAVVGIMKRSKGS